MLSKIKFIRYNLNEKFECMGISWTVGELVVLFYGVSTHFGSLNAELSHFDKNFKQFSLA